MRKLITGMKISVDGKMEGPEGTADWVEAWSEDYGLMTGPSFPARCRSATSTHCRGVAGRRFICRHRK